MYKLVDLSIVIPGHNWEVYFYIEIHYILFLCETNMQYISIKNKYKFVSFYNQLNLCNNLRVQKN